LYIISCNNSIIWCNIRRTIQSICHINIDKHCVSCIENRRIIGVIYTHREVLLDCIIRYIISSNGDSWHVSIIIIVCILHECIISNNSLSNIIFDWFCLNLIKLINSCACCSDTREPNGGILDKVGCILYSSAIICSNCLTYKCLCA